LRWNERRDIHPVQPRSGGMMLGVGVSPRSKWNKT